MSDLSELCFNSVDNCNKIYGGKEARVFTTKHLASVHE